MLVSSNAHVKSIALFTVDYFNLPSKVEYFNVPSEDSSDESTDSEYDTDNFSDTDLEVGKAYMCARLSRPEIHGFTENCCIFLDQLL